VSPAVFTPEALADRWATTADIICAMCRDGRLRAFKVGREWRIALSAVEAVERGEVAA
jgi:excisionase family DNA binding protein